VSLKQRTFSAGRWTATSALVRSGLQILQTVVLARLLVPADFGLMAVTVSILAVLGLFTDLGLSRAIIHFEDISDDALASLYWLNLLMGVVLSLLFAAAPPLLGDIFGLAGLKSVLLATSPRII
jgi:O-antigen/teichoic acid export membrane protein